MFHLVYIVLLLGQVRYYRMFGDAIDGEGHGTHCAGSAVGGLANGALTLSTANHMQSLSIALMFSSRLHAGD